MGLQRTWDSSDEPASSTASYWQLGGGTKPTPFQWTSMEKLQQSMHVTMKNRCVLCVLWIFPFKKWDAVMMFKQWGVPRVLVPGWFTLGAVLKRICRLGISQFRSDSQWQCWKWNSNSTDHGPGIRIKQDNQWLSSMALLISLGDGVQHSNWMCQSNGAGWGRIHFFAKKKGDGMPPKANAHCSTCCTNSLASNADQTLRLPVQATRKQN